MALKLPGNQGKRHMECFQGSFLVLLQQREPFKELISFYLHMMDKVRLAASLYGFLFNEGR